MRTIWVVVVGLALSGCAILNSGSAFAEDSGSAIYIMRGCRDALAEKDNALSGLCAGTIDGIYFSRETICAPPTVTVEQLVRVVVQYVDNRPARMHEAFKVLALEAMTTAWPCRR
ncbi:Rap1a/Tai family immunity protein [Bradyrhizobium sp. I1.7.5]|uniref:Rap1a/Tai family immunity protein n=1 Tax=Bradyrhizobium sp. I1.7.5 TaxID=3156363 RepID=UPI003391CA45